MRKITIVLFAVFAFVLFTGENNAKAQATFSYGDETFLVVNDLGVLLGDLDCRILTASNGKIQIKASGEIPAWKIFWILGFIPIPYIDEVYYIDLVINKNVTGAKGKTGGSNWVANGTITGPGGGVLLKGHGQWMANDEYDQILFEPGGWLSWLTDYYLNIEWK